jgi:hypothetical protein
MEAQMKLKLYLLILGAAGAAQAQVAPARDVLRLLPGSPIYLSASEPGPIQRAAKDLQRDLKNILGADSSIINRLDPRQRGAGILIAGTAPEFAQFRNPAISGRESHGVFTRGPLVVLQGADMRGTIYAIYTFSERFLGVPPLWVWSSWQPAKKDSLGIPAGTDLRFPSPYVRWRVCRPDDQDLLIPWRAKSQENYEAFLETILRLKMNALGGDGMMDPGSYDHPYQASRSARAARDRGLAVVGVHTEILGSSLNNWDLYWRKIRKQEPPKLTVANTAALEDFWRYHIETGIREKLETVWLVGFRGHRDVPFWKETFPDAIDVPATDAERAHVIEQMVARQIALLKKVTGDPAPLMHLDLWNENSDFFTQGLLHPPAEPNLILVFCSALRNHFPGADIRGYRNDAGRPIGYHLNFNYTSCGAHLTQAQGPWRMEESFRIANASSGRPLEWSLVDVGNLREFVLELSANARMMWDFDGYRTDAFMDEFCAQYFGRANAPRVAALYRDFYNTYWTQKKPDLPGFERQYLFYDLRYARALDEILAQLPKGRDLDPLYDWRSDYGMPVTGKDDKKDLSGRFFSIVPEDNGAKTQIEAILTRTAASTSKLTAVVARADALLSSLPRQEGVFFNDNLRVQARFMLDLNKVLHDVAQAMEVLPDRRKAVDSLQAAGRAASAMYDDLREAEHGRFTGWYDSERIFGLNQLKEKISLAIRALGGGTHAPKF